MAQTESKYDNCFVHLFDSTEFGKPELLEATEVAMGHLNVSNFDDITVRKFKDIETGQLCIGVETKQKKGSL